MADLFKDIINSILQGKKYALEDPKEYVPFVVNRALSNYEDSIYFAQEMNVNWNLDNRMQYDFLFHGLRKYRRPYNKDAWSKPVKNEDLQAVKLFFGYSTPKAIDAINILSEEQLSMIKKTITG